MNRRKNVQTADELSGATEGSTVTRLSGSGMDRQIEKRPFYKRYRWPIASIALLLLALLAFWQFSDHTRVFSVDREQLNISTVTSGVFEDNIPIRGRLSPLVTVFLDATVGGRVEEVFVENGALLGRGDPILRLSNAALQLEVIAREADVAEQQNALATLQLELQRTQLANRRQLEDINYNILRLERQIDIREPLVPEGVTRQEFDDLSDELAYNRRLQKLTREAEETEELLQRQQSAQIESSLQRLEQNLIVTRENLETLNVNATIGGQLTAFEAVVGQSIAQGERIGRIDSPSEFKLIADIDEFYLNRIDIGQRATANIGREAYTLEIVDINPEVTSGRFQIDLNFEGQQPSDIRRGQTIQGQLTLGEPAPSLLLPSGAFYRDTGGTWVFVVLANGSEAIRRNVQLGRRNSRFIEVTDGLDSGEQVITSPYTSFLNFEKLVIR